MKMTRLIVGLAMLVLHGPVVGWAEEGNVLLEENSPAIHEGRLVEDIGVETVGGVLTPLLKRGCVLPCRASFIFSTAEDR